MKEYDVYRDSNWRYLGYANEVGEAFRPLIHRSIVTSSYVVATGYCCADAYDKSSKAHARGESAKNVIITAADVLVWQMFASVIIPGFTINRITWITSRLLRSSKMRKEIVTVTPTVVGLCSIPFIVQPIDRFVDYVMDIVRSKL